MIEPYRLVFDRLASAESPNATTRERIYDACRAEVAGACITEIEQEKALSALEKAIRRQEIQALYEESLNGS